MDYWLISLKFSDYDSKYLTTADTVYVKSIKSKDNWLRDVIDNEFA